MTAVTAVYIALIAAAEAVTVLWGAGLGLVCHALLVVALLNHFIALGRPSKGALANPNASFWFIDILPALALAPLARILALTLVVPALPPLAWHALVGGLVLLAIWLTARLLGHGWTELGLTGRGWPRQLGIALIGAPLGILAYLLARPEPLTAALDWPATLVGSVILTLSVGLPSELIFRGMLQRSATEVFGRTGLLWSSLLFAAMFLIWRSPGYLLFAFGIGIVFGWIVRRTGSLVGVTLAHGLFASGLFLVWPHLLR
jgi:membrane protease YdiL (CAAX protease family)